MAVKIVRQSDKIALLGAPTSAAAMSAGLEGAPSALRAAGLIELLRDAGYEVVDHGDDPVQVFEPDTESPRARNIPGVLKSIDALKPRVEQLVKSGALPLILAGDCSVALGTLAGARRYFRSLSMIYMDADADLNTPASTSSGCLDGMVVSHLTGRGAPELVRFWSEPFLVREPDLALFGFSRLDPPEEKVLETSPLRRYSAVDVKKVGAAAAAKTALDRIRGNGNDFILHLDADVISDFSATNYPSSNGLTFEEVREALLVFAQQRNLAAIEVTAYNPTKDPDGSGARKIVELLAEVLRVRLETLREAEAAAAVSAAASPAPKPAVSPKIVAAPEPDPAEIPEEIALPDPIAGEGWSSDAIDSGVETESDTESASEDADDQESSSSHS